MINENTFGVIYNSTSTQTCVLHKICHNLIGWKYIFCILFATQQLFDNFNYFKMFFQCKSD